MRIGARAARPIRVPGLTHDVTLEIVENDAQPSTARLALGCAGGIERGVRPTSASPTACTLSVPPRTSERFTFGSRPKGLAPFEIVMTRGDEVLPEAPQSD